MIDDGRVNTVRYQRSNRRASHSILQGFRQRGMGMSPLNDSRGISPPQIEFLENKFCFFFIFKAFRSSLSIV
jgi:hypothetical protein